LFSTISAAGAHFNTFSGLDDSPRRWLSQNKLACPVRKKAYKAFWLLAPLDEDLTLILKRNLSREPKFPSPF